MGTWKNSDGLYIKYGTDAGISPSRAGSPSVYGPEQMIEVEITLSELTQTETILNDAVVLPANSFINRVEVITEVAAATGTAIDVGLIRISDRSTEIDYDGILAAFVRGTMDSVGEITRFTKGSSLPASITTQGALVGASSGVYPAHISASMTDATAFTAGRIKVRIFYEPNALSTNETQA